MCYIPLSPRATGDKHISSSAFSSSIDVEFCSGMRKRRNEDHQSNVAMTQGTSVCSQQMTFLRKAVVLQANFFNYFLYFRWENEFCSGMLRPRNEDNQGNNAMTRDVSVCRATPEEIPEEASWLPRYYRQLLSQLEKTSCILRRVDEDTHSKYTFIRESSVCWATADGFHGESI